MLEMNEYGALKFIKNCYFNVSRSYHSLTKVFTVILFNYFDFMFFHELSKKIYGILYHSLTVFII